MIEDQPDEWVMPKDSDDQILPRRRRGELPFGDALDPADEAIVEYLFGALIFVCVIVFALLGIGAGWFVYRIVRAAAEWVLS